MLEAKKICKNYGRTKALNQAELSMRPGEIRALLGSNGSGKSTIAKVLGGLVKMNSGEIYIDNKLIQISSARDALDMGIALAYQDYSLVDDLTIEENLFLNIDITTKTGFINKKKRREETIKILERFHISARPDEYVKALDESSKSLLEVAKTLVYKPEYLILDEVTACLHSDQVDILFDILRNEKEKGLSILFISHRFNEVYNLCDKVTIFRNGQTAFVSELDKVNRDEIVFYMTGQKETASKQWRKVIDKADKDPLISVKNMTIGGQVNDVSLDLYPGEILGICGLQGQGQSEFLRAIYGYQEITEGDVFYKGERQTRLSPRKSLKNGIAFVSGDRQSEGIFPDRSILENIIISQTALKFIFKGINLKNSRDKARKMIEDLSIKIGEIKHPASSLSGGNQQKLVFARNLLLNLSVLLLDDPTKGVDVRARKEIQDILRELVREGLACLYFSSDYKELTAISDRIVVFYEGRITDEFNEVSTDIEGQLAAAMLGADEVGV